ncbi:MAG: EVE domain-containing protein [Candidatus Lloydbacteria bacterium RIFOXYC12_FULL_46_25]|uniref:EVE domain-containing protein n=1 Tax=Candidatus Lloydbacteria bacterium RIFOXYC12_FULL_46_25 TaxID=1798670 RepID=A0A1G2DVB6_9BACT|nr:MAG: EVE domain-containing protein [Candidatus Lloydbacteria bacterium RIFOXYC12_FULL_46_25]
MTSSKGSSTRVTQYWLMKSEPGEFSIDDLRKKKKHHWDGVRNFEARNFMRDKMRIGDLVLFYHSNATPSGVVGIAKVASSPYPDFTQWDKASKYFDKKAGEEKPIWFMVDVAFVEQFPRTIKRSELQNTAALKSMALWKRNRLSITPVTKKEFEVIQKLASKTSLA